MLPTLDGEWVDREAGRMGLGKVRQEGGEEEKKSRRLVPARRVRGADTDVHGTAMHACARCKEVLIELPPCRSDRSTNREVDDVLSV